MSKSLSSSKPPRAIVAGVAGRGDTVTAARADAEAQIERMLSGGYTPFTFATPLAIGLIWREPRLGWQAVVVPRDLPSGSNLRLMRPSSLSERTSEQAWRSLRSDMLMDYVFACGLTDEALAAAVALIVGEPELIDDLAQQVSWQRCFKQWEALGYPNHRCHSLACEKRWPKLDEPTYQGSEDNS